MRGHIRKRERLTAKGRKTTRYFPVVYVGVDPVTGRKRYDEGAGFRTRREAEDALTAKLGNLCTGDYVPSTKLTLSDYARNTWLPTARARVKPTTYRGYSWMLDRYLLPLLGSKRLQQITTADLNTAYARLLVGDLPTQPKRTRRETPNPERQVADHPRAYRPRSNGPLSAKTVHNVHALVSKLLADAVADGFVQRNPAARARPPRVVSPEIEAWSASQLNAFLCSIHEERDYALWHLAAMSGMRRGELLGLRWSDLDLAASKLAVRRNLVVGESGKIELTTPKNRQARVIDLDTETVDVLRRHNKRLAADRLAFGPGYARTDVVFPGFDGRALHPDIVSKRFGNLRDDAISGEVVERRITLHGLRHTHASLALQAGIPIKVVSERLGHASPAFTIAVYQHCLPSMQAEAASAIARLVRSANDSSDAEELGS